MMVVLAIVATACFARPAAADAQAENARLKATVSMLQRKIARLEKELAKLKAPPAADKAVAPVAKI